MGFNYAREKKKFEREWAKLRKEYEEAGMSAEDIQSLYEFDLAVFRSERTYVSHTQALPSEYIDEDELERSTLFRKFVSSMVTFDEADFPERYAWVDTIENQELARMLRKLTDADLELLTFLVLEEHTQREFARKWGWDPKAVSRRFLRISQDHPYNGWLAMPL